jgi:small subunit ribosomal protein S29
VYDPRTRTYLQPAYASQTLRDLLKVNLQLLQELSTPEDIPIEGRDTVPMGVPLTDLIAAGVKDQNSAPAVLSALLEILGKQKEYVVRYKTTSIASEGFHQVPGLTRNRRFPSAVLQNVVQGPSFFDDQIISPFYAQTVAGVRQWEKVLRMFYSHSLVPSSLFNARPFMQARGAVLGALSMANTTFGAPIELRESLKLGHGTAGPYTKRSSVLASYAEGLTNVPVPESLAVPEAASVFDIWMKDKAIPRGARRFILC